MLRQVLYNLMLEPTEIIEVGLPSAHSHINNTYTTYMYNVSWGI